VKCAKLKHISTYDGCQKAVSECKPLPNYEDFRFWSLELKCMELSRLESEHVDLFICNELLVGKKLHPLTALLFLEKLKGLQFFYLRNELKLFLCLDSFFLLLYKTQGRVFSDHRRMMQIRIKGN